LLNFQETVDLQDKLLIKLGKSLKGSVLSGSFALVRAYTQHRVENTIDIFFSGEKPCIPERLERFTIKDKKEVVRWEKPEKVKSTIISVDSDNGQVLNLRLTQDTLKGISGKTPLEIGFFLEDLEGIYYRVLLDYLHNPQDFMLALDVAYIDNEYHLVDFFPQFQKRFPDFSEEDLKKSFGITKLQMEKNHLRLRGLFLSGWQLYLILP